MVLDEWSGPAGIAAVLLFCAFFLAVMVMVFAPYYKGEQVGNVDSGRQPKGVPGARRLAIVVRRVGGGRRRRADVNLVCRAGAVSHVEALDQVMASHFVELLDEALAAASQRPVADEIGKGEVGAIEVGVFRAGDGKAWVGLTWRLQPLSTTLRTCLAPAAASNLAQMVRIGCNPGERLGEAKRNFWRDLHRRKHGDAGGNPSP